tara:strand:+ start:258 stop:431 length:174 start_codon:yes stop_codon:yes gene_type:complete
MTPSSPPFCQTATNKAITKDTIAIDFLLFLIISFILFLSFDFYIKKEGESPLFSLIL